MRCDPVDSGALHRHRLYLSRLEPLRHPDQLARRSPEIGHFSTASLYRRGAHPVPFAPEINPRYLVPNDRQPCDLFRTVSVILALVAVTHLLRLSEHDSPGWPVGGFWPRGVLQEPRQCSIARLGPCFLWGIRTNGERAVTAAVSSRSIPPLSARPQSQSVQSGQPEAQLSSATCQSHVRHLRRSAGHALRFCPLGQLLRVPENVQQHFL